MKIMAETGMERMPETCMTCELNGAKGAQCSALGTYINRTGRHRACPLVEIDETLPVQLDCAEGRLRREERLGNGG